jgi:hypothetical protein
MDSYVPRIAHPVPPNTSNTSGPSSGTASTLVPIILPPQLDCALYPNIVHWDEDAYQGSRKGGKRGGEDDPEKKSKGPVLSSFMEEEDGSEVTKTTKKAIGNAAKGLFNRLLQDGVAPTTWGQATLDAQHALIHSLETQFPFLRFCKNHWKSRMVATNSYSQWYRKAIQRKLATTAKGNNEAEAIEVDEELPRRPHAQDDNARPSKRPRLEDTTATPTPHPTPRLTPRPTPHRVATNTGPQLRKVCILYPLGYTRI